MEGLLTFFEMVDTAVTTILALGATFFMALCLAVLPWGFALMAAEVFPTKGRLIMRSGDILGILTFASAAWAFWFHVIKD